MILSTQRLDKAAEAILPQMITRDISDDNNFEARRRIARAAITAYLGDDMVVVPREPTEAMLLAARNVPIKRTTRSADAEIYRAMLSASLTERDA